MTVFQISEEQGYTRRLMYDDLPLTPWLLETASGLKNEFVEFHQIVLSERGYMPMNPLNFDNLLARENYDELYDNLPEWSILTPRLYPAADNLKQSLEYELNLFLDRLDEVELPKAFGLVYDLVHNDESFLEELLSFEPSVIVLRYPYIEDESPRRVLENLYRIRSMVPENIALYLPGSGGLGYQTVLIALGFDIVDDLAAYRYAARQRGYIDQQVFYLPEFSIGELARRNRDALHRDFDNIVFHLKNNTLWSKFDKDMHVDPHVASFRHLIAHDEKYALDLVRFKKFADNYIKFIGEEGLYHPDVLAYQRRVLERYEEKEWVKVVVLLPCSAKKPYRESYSHRRYEKALQAGAQEKRSRIGVWSLTSPLGVVPRDIETVYPAQYYDIPVTGNWTHEEVRITGELLGKMLQKLDDDVLVVAHVSKDYEKMINTAREFREIKTSWINDKSRSDEALEALSTTIRQLLENVEPADYGRKGAYIEARNTIQAITKYNHGPDVELDFDYERVRIIGRPPRPIAIQKDRKHWITWDKLGGDVRLHERATLDIAGDTDNWILVGADKLRGSNLFAVGVVAASEAISPGDEVIFFNGDKSKVLGLGVATLSGKSMMRVNYGIAATIRKKFVRELEGQ